MYLSMELKILLKKIEPFIALSILLMLILIAFALHKENELNKIISEKCGWEGEDFECYCIKDNVDTFKRIQIDNFTVGEIGFS